MFKLLKICPNFCPICGRFRPIFEWLRPILLFWKGPPWFMCKIISQVFKLSLIKFRQPTFGGTLT
uniref:Uncharacterized protein n=1 Tax=Meloidogyne enterolobii TaxID=390850 RepID=A0A6V7VGT2_MELEN|nr:unnamed protein product [Meloidogyne enterolobii]